jgi:hypothetical protein
LDESTPGTQILDSANGEDPLILPLYLTRMVESFRMPSFTEGDTHIWPNWFPEQLRGAVTKLLPLEVPMGQRVSGSLGFNLVCEYRLVLYWFLAVNPELPIPVSALCDIEIVFEHMRLLSVCQQQVTHRLPVLPRLRPLPDYKNAKSQESPTRNFREESLFCISSEKSGAGTLLMTNDE